MRKLVTILFLAAVIVAGASTFALTAESGKGVIGVVGQKTVEINRGLPKTERNCIECHLKKMPQIVLDWKNSMHGRANVSCGDCHIARKTDVDALQCSGLKGSSTYVTLIPTPQDCSRCHPVEAKQFSESDHAVAYKSVDKLEGMSVTWEGKGSEASEASGCIQCHGKKIIFKDGRPTGLRYPQEGVGRPNPDGSVGNCTSCHTRHRFNIVEARKAETCGSCHLGPDHPQIEIWQESKHGKRYASEGDSWTWDSAPDAWAPGDYSAPTCAVCHMSGIGKLQTTHNNSQRLSWEAERPLSIRTTNWEKKLAEMKSVCGNCHGPQWVNSYYKQYDAAIELYNEKYYKPAKKMMDELYAAGLLTKDKKWDDEAELVFYYLWHHEGRRARMGTAMMGQDYAHWHGFFETAQDLDKLTKIYKELMKK